MDESGGHHTKGNELIKKKYPLWDPIHLRYGVKLKATLSRLMIARELGAGRKQFFLKGFSSPWLKSSRVMCHNMTAPNLTVLFLKAQPANFIMYFTKLKINHTSSLSLFYTYIRNQKKSLVDCCVLVKLLLLPSLTLTDKNSQLLQFRDYNHKRHKN